MYYRSGVVFSCIWQYVKERSEVVGDDEMEFIVGD